MTTAHIIRTFLSPDAYGGGPAELILLRSETTVRAATHGRGRAALNKALNTRKSFRTSGALSGRTVSDVRWECAFSPGRLNGEDLAAWRSAVDAEAVVYVVESYATPIAWVEKFGDRERIHFVSQRFSPTTSKHQGMLWALGMPAGHFDR